MFKCLCKKNDKYDQFEDNLFKLGFYIHKRKHVKFLVKYLQSYAQKCYIISTKNSVTASIINIPNAKSEAEYMIANIEEFTGRKFNPNLTLSVKKKELPVPNQVIQTILDPEDKCVIFKHDRYMTKENQILVNYACRVDKMTIDIDWYWKNVIVCRDGVNLCFYFDNIYEFSSKYLIKQKCYSLWKLLYHVMSSESRYFLITQLFVERKFEFFATIEATLKQSDVSNYWPWVFQYKFKDESMKMNAISFALTVCIFHSGVRSLQSVNWFRNLTLFYRNIYMTKLVVSHYIRTALPTFRSLDVLQRVLNYNFSQFPIVLGTARLVCSLKRLIIHENKQLSLYDLFVCKNSTRYFRFFFWNEKLFKKSFYLIQAFVSDKSITKVLILQLAKIDYLVRMAKAMEKIFPYPVLENIISGVPEKDIIVALEKDSFIKLINFF